MCRASAQDLACAGGTLNKKLLNKRKKMNEDGL